MALLLCHQYPALRIYNPQTGGFAAFLYGKLEIEPDDPDYEVVMAEASRNPAIVVVESIGTCAYCGEQFVGGNAKLLLGGHIKDVHYDKYLEQKDAEESAVRNVELKSREGFACDVCQPLQVFGTNDDLTLHVLTMHANAPEMDEAGNAMEVPDQPRKKRRPGEVS
jgi:hypothetical protein